MADKKVYLSKVKKESGNNFSEVKFSTHITILRTPFEEDWICDRWQLLDVSNS